jgi:hypothetical protein
MRKSDPLEQDSLIPEQTKWDWLTPLCLLGLCLMSIIFIHSAQAFGGGNYWKMQILWSVIGFSLYAVVSVINYQLWMRYAHIFYFRSNYWITFGFWRSNDLRCSQVD